MITGIMIYYPVKYSFERWRRVPRSSARKLILYNYTLKAAQFDMSGVTEFGR